MKRNWILHKINCCRYRYGERLCVFWTKCTHAIAGIQMTGFSRTLSMWIWIYLNKSFSVVIDVADMMPRRYLRCHRVHTISCRSFDMIHFDDPINPIIRCVPYVNVRFIENRRLYTIRIHMSTKVWMDPWKSEMYKKSQIRIWNGGSHGSVIQVPHIFRMTY